MTHKHHILPKYKGGTDNPSNLVQIPVTRHAMFHYCNWQLWGDKRDWLAWKGLIGEISQEERVLELRRIGGRIGGRANGEKPETKSRMRELASKTQSKATLAATTPEAKAKRKNSLAKINHSQGENNSQFGTRWVTNGERNLKVPKDAPIPEGFRAGRVIKTGT
jgi:hypothetical protein